MATFGSIAGWLRRAGGKGAIRTHEIPHAAFGSVALVSCDPVYLEAHALALINSISTNSPNLRVHLHVVGRPSAGLDPLLEALRSRVRCAVEWSAEDPVMDGWSAEARRTYYACSRFRIAADCMASDPADYFILDADSVVRRPLEPPAADFGFMLRTKKRPFLRNVPVHLRAFGSLVYAAPTPHGRAYLLDIQKQLTGLRRPEDLRWYSDQIALWRAYSRSLARGARFHSFNKTDIDWDFHEDATIWTAKGDRKSAAAYLAEVEKYDLRAIEGAPRAPDRSSPLS